MNLLDKIWIAIRKYRYESDGVLKNYIRSQYGPFLKRNPYYDSESFYQKILLEIQPYIKDNMKVLDVGCATGRVSFELASLGDVVCTGTDQSKKFIEFSNKFRNFGVKRINFPKRKVGSVNFIVDDILDTKLNNNDYDIIVCINIFDRVDNPPKLFEVLYGLLKNNGILLIVDPYDWSMSLAPKELQFNDMKLFLDNKLWSLERELKDLDYSIPMNYWKNWSYICHLLIARKK